MDATQGLGLAQSAACISLCAAYMGAAVGHAAHNPPAGKSSSTPISRCSQLDSRYKGLVIQALKTDYIHQNSGPTAIRVAVM